MRKRIVFASCLLPLVAVAGLFRVDASARPRAKRTPTPTAVTTPAPTASASPTPSPIATAAPTPSTAPLPTVSPSVAPVTSDALTRRVRAELKVFTDWLAVNNVKGYMGEFGWPNNFTADQAKYNALAETYLADMRAAGVTGAAWATGEWWGTTYNMSGYVASGSTAVNTTRAQASVLERYTDVAGIR